MNGIWQKNSAFSVAKIRKKAESLVFEKRHQSNQSQQIKRRFLRKDTHYVLECTCILNSECGFVIGYISFDAPIRFCNIGTVERTIDADLSFTLTKNNIICKLNGVTFGLVTSNSHNYGVNIIKEVSRGKCSPNSSNIEASNLSLSELYSIAEDDCCKKGNNSNEYSLEFDDYRIMIS